MISAGLSLLMISNHHCLNVSFSCHNEYYRLMYEYEKLKQHLSKVFAKDWKYCKEKMKEGGEKERK